jgi:hypothetical protein
MDKKKVEELIEQAIIWSRYANQHSVISNLEEALKELNKSDWVSVEDGLPEYGERVNVYSKKKDHYNTIARTKVIDYHYDNNGFLSCLHVTHWKPIEKLEE